MPKTEKRLSRAELIEKVPPKKLQELIDQELEAWVMAEQLDLTEEELQQLFDIYIPARKVKVPKRKDK